MLAKAGLIIANGIASRLQGGLLIVLMVAKEDADRAAHILGLEQAERA